MAGETRASDSMSRGLFVGRWQEMAALRVSLEAALAGRGRLVMLVATTAQPSSAPAYPNDLSPREVELLRFLAVGKSNRDIADALFISLNTVATHVRNILTKTNSANRTEAATMP